MRNVSRLGVRCPMDLLQTVQLCESIVTMRWVSTKVTNTRDNCSVLVLLAVVVLLAPKAPRTLARRKSLRWTARGLREAVRTVEVAWFIDGVPALARFEAGNGDVLSLTPFA